MGEVVQTKPGADGQVREVVIKYQNAGEKTYRLTPRASRSVVKIWPLVKLDLVRQLKEVARIYHELTGEIIHLTNTANKKENLQKVNVVSSVKVHSLLQSDLYTDSLSASFGLRPEPSDAGMYIVMEDVTGYEGSWAKNSNLFVRKRKTECEK